MKVEPIFFDKEGITERFLVAVDRLKGKGPNAHFKDDSDLCRKIGITPQALQNVRTNPRNNASLRMIYGLQKLCGSDFDMREVLLDDFEHSGYDLPKGWVMIKEDSLNSIISLLEATYLETKNISKKTIPF